MTQGSHEDICGSLELFACQAMPEFQAREEAAKPATGEETQVR